MKNFIFFTKDGYTFDSSNTETQNMQILGTGEGSDILDAFKNFKHQQSYIFKLAFKNIIALEYMGDIICNLEL